VAFSGVWSSFLFPVVGGVLAVLFAIVLSRFSAVVILTIATALEGGAAASCFVLKSTLPYLMDIARGYPYVPNSGNESKNGAHSLSLGSYSKQQELLMSIAWITSSLVIAAAVVYRDGHFRNLNVLGFLRQGDTLRCPKVQEMRPSNRGCPT
jgi:hypothetical protein